MIEDYDIGNNVILRLGNLPKIGIPKMKYRVYQGLFSNPEDTQSEIMGMSYWIIDADSMEQAVAKLKYQLAEQGVEIPEHIFVMKEPK